MSSLFRKNAKRKLPTAVVAGEINGGDGDDVIGSGGDDDNAVSRSKQMPVEKQIY